MRHVVSNDSSVDGVGYGGKEVALGRIGVRQAPGIGKSYVLFNECDLGGVSFRVLRPAGVGVELFVAHVCFAYVG